MSCGESEGEEDEDDVDDKFYEGVGGDVSSHIEGIGEDDGLCFIKTEDEEQYNCYYDVISGRL